MKHFKIIFKVLLSLSAAFLASTARADQTFTAEYLDSVEVSLLTCQPHDEIYSLYGHTALRWHDLHDEETDIAALSEKIVASYDREREADTTTVFPVAKPMEEAEREDATVMFTAAGGRKAKRHRAQKEEEPAGKKEQSSFSDTAKHPFKLADLKFGRNYNAEDET